jgi:hypothetical protein
MYPSTFGHVTTRVRAVGVLDQSNPRTQARLDMFQVAGVPLECWIRQTHVPKHVWTCSKLRTCRWSVVSDKPTYPSKFGHVPSCVYISYRPNEPFVPKHQEAVQFVIYCWRKISDKNLEQRINTKLWVKIGKSSGETALITLAYSEGAKKKWSVF